MTCIVGLVAEGTVYIGGDSAGVAGYDMTVRADLKVFSNDGFIFGFTSSFRMGQLLRYALSTPKRDPKKDLDNYMATDFIDAIRNCLKNGGFSTTKEGAENGGYFLVGHSGRLFCVESDYQVAESVLPYMACGCGKDLALGSMFATPSMEPKKRITLALKAAEQHNSGVRGPFHIEKT